MQDSAARITRDVQKASEEGWKFGAKLVRGAYIHAEQKRAAELGYPSPIRDSLEATHQNYNRLAPLILCLFACC